MMKKLIRNEVLLCIMLVIAKILWHTAMRNTVIINTSIRVYHSVGIIFSFMILIWIIMAVVTLIIFKHEKHPKPEITDESGMTEANRKNLYDIVKGYRTGKWNAITDIGHLCEQLDDMNEYQENLDFLLMQTEYLTDRPVEILQRLENCMYVNIKKILNYMCVLQEKDCGMMKQKVQECICKNADLLQKAKDFVIAVTDYVNNDMSPGEDEKAITRMNSYMYMVLDAIEKEDIYLT